MIGRKTTDELLGAVGLLESDVLLASLSRLISAQMIEEPRPSVFRFDQDKIREVAYAQMDPGQRRDCHRAVALALETLHGTHADQARWCPVLAHHWHESIDPAAPQSDRVARALDCLERAGQQAVIDGQSLEKRSTSGWRPARSATPCRATRPRSPTPPTRNCGGSGNSWARVGRPTCSNCPRRPTLGSTGSSPPCWRCPPAFMSHQFALSGLVSARSLTLTLERGRTPFCAAVFNAAAHLVRHALEDSHLADEFIELAADEDKRSGGMFHANVAMIRGWFIKHWIRPLAEGIEPTRIGAEAGFASGDLLFGAMGEATCVVLEAESGAELDRVVARAEDALRHINRIVYVSAFHCLLERQHAQSLMGRNRGPTSLTDDRYDEARDLASIRRTSSLNQIVDYSAYRLRLHYLWGQYAEAATLADEA